jgi:hypothetical protein
MYQSNQVQFDWTILFDMEYSISVPIGSHISLVIVAGSGVVVAGMCTLCGW